MNNEQPVSVVLPLACAMFVVLFLGLWTFYWYVVWPPPLVGVLAAIVGGLCGLPFVINRLLHWDVRRWQWRDAQRRNRTYPAWQYQLALYGGVVGMAISMAAGWIFGDEQSESILIPLIGAYLVTFFLWGFVASLAHFSYRLFGDQRPR